MNVSEYQELYRTEAEDILQALETGLIHLESTADRAGAVNELFRQAHNLKGISGAMGYEEVVEASHALENVLDRYRKGEAAVTPFATDCLLRAADCLKALVGRSLGGAPSAPDDSLDRLREALARITDTDVPDSAAPAPAPAAAPGAAAPAPAPTAPASEESPAAADGAPAAPFGESLATKITSTKISLERLDRLMDLVGELSISRIRLSALAADIGSKHLQDELALSWRIISQVQKEVMEARLIPVGQVFQRFNRLVRDAAREMGKSVRLETVGAEIGLDRVVLERMVDPLVHCIRNALDHGIETPEARAAAGKPPEACIALRARRERNNVVLEVADDGRGIDFRAVAESGVAAGIVAKNPADITEEDICAILTAPGFSTTATADRFSGRGMGMNIVKKAVDSFGGSIRVSSTLGRGTTVSLSLPVNLSIIKALLFQVGRDVHAVPIEYVRETTRIETGSLRTVGGAEVYSTSRAVIPVVRPSTLFGAEVERMEGRFLKTIVVETGRDPVALVVEKILGQQDIVIKALPPMVRRIKGISGATVLGSGRVAFVWDPHVLFQGRCSYEPDKTAVVLEN